LFKELKQQYPSLSTLSYINDIALATSGRKESDNVKELTKAARKAFQWADQNAVSFDDSKSELMHFTRRRELKGGNEMDILLPNGTRITPSQELRWLGIWLDRKMTFNQHVNRKIASASRVLQEIQHLSNTES